MSDFIADQDKFSEMLFENLKRMIPNKEEKYIKAFIKKVIETDAGFISKETVLDKYHFCERCGECCKDVPCPELRGNLCGVWNTKPNICTLYPYWEVPGDSHGIHFVPDCPYAFKVVLYECMNILRG